MGWTQFGRQSLYRYGVAEFLDDLRCGKRIDNDVNQWRRDGMLKWFQSRVRNNDWIDYVSSEAMFVLDNKKS